MPPDSPLPRLRARRACGEIHEVAADVVEQLPGELGLRPTDPVAAPGGRKHQRVRLRAAHRGHIVRDDPIGPRFSGETTTLLFELGGRKTRFQLEGDEPSRGGGDST